MQLRVPKYIFINALMLLLTGILLSGCSKNNDPGSGSRFKATDFQITNIETTHSGSDFIISYEITNTTSIDYDFDIDGDFSVRFSIRTTDGAWYEDSRAIPTNISAGFVAATQLVINIPPNKTPDLNTLKYEVYAD